MIGHTSPYIQPSTPIPVDQFSRTIMAMTTSQSIATPVTAFPETFFPIPDIEGYVLPLISSPVNIVLFMILLYVIYLRLRPHSPSQISVISDEPIVFTYYTPLELS